jgi:hypothetical protein
LWVAGCLSKTENVHDQIPFWGKESTVQKLLRNA